MSDVIFIGPAQIEIQGDRVLRLMAPTNGYAEYQTIGFDAPIVLVRDYRPVGLRALDEVLETGDVDRFAPQFNAPAHVTISTPDSSQILIELRQTDDRGLAHMLWIAIGIEEYVPVYDYVFEHIVPLDDERFALLALYRRSRHPERVPLPAFSAAC